MARSGAQALRDFPPAAKLVDQWLLSRATLRHMEEISQSEPVSRQEICDRIDRLVGRVMDARARLLTTDEERSSLMSDLGELQALALLYGPEA